jgi:enoyl-CoA hydratase/carnithine racemase
MTSEVLYSVGDRVATITLKRPEKLNAWTPRMQVQLKETILRAADESEVRVIVVTGAGRGFCAGADLGDLGRPALMQRDCFSDMPDADARHGDFEQPLSYPLGVPKCRSSRESMARSPASGFALLFFATSGSSRPTLD